MRILRTALAAILIVGLVVAAETIRERRNDPFQPGYSSRAHATVYGRLLVVIHVPTGPLDSRVGVWSASAGIPDEWSRDDCRPTELDGTLTVTGTKSASFVADVGGSVAVTWLGYNKFASMSCEEL